MSREAVAGAARLVVKVGSSSLATPAGGLDHGAVDRLVDAFAGRIAEGAQLVLVSSGAIAAGLAPLGLSRRPTDLATQQAAASVGQGALVARWSDGFARHGHTVGQVLLTADDVVRRSHWRNAQRTFERLLGLRVVPVVNENDTVATEEIRFGDNDRLAALVTHLVRADALVLLSDVDGLHSADPGRDAAATRIAEVDDPARLDALTVGTAGRAGTGRGGMVTKVAAARIAAGAGVPTVLAAASDAAAALGGADVGTCFHPTGPRLPARMLWLAHATEPRGRLALDAGAVAAVTERRLSLLAAGVTGVAGSFVAGDAVDLTGPDGVVFARGLAGYDADELPALLGRRTDDLVAELGPSYSREVIHRDDIALL
jgi:glutamate 5-kinase